MAALAATSSPGVRVSDGSADAWSGRTSVPTVAPTALARKRAGSQAPATMMTTVAIDASARTSWTMSRSRVGGCLLAGPAANGAAMTEGAIRTTPRIPTASGPPLW